MRGRALGPFSPAAGLPWNDRQNDMGRVWSVVKDRLYSWDQLSALAEGMAGVWITVKAWEIGAGDLNPDAVPSPENVARRPQIDGVFVYPTWLNWLRLGQRFPIPGPYYAVGQALRISVGMEVDQLRCKVSINS